MEIPQALDLTLAFLECLVVATDGFDVSVTIVLFVVHNRLQLDCIDNGVVGATLLCLAKHIATIRATSQNIKNLVPSSMCVATFFELW
jgi:hypothetical protein